jgi:hypothetical protein
MEMTMPVPAGVLSGIAAADSVALIAQQRCPHRMG